MTRAGESGADARAERLQFARFALLRQQSAGLPAQTRHALGAPVFGMNLDLARRIPVTLSGAYWLVPGTRYLCVISQKAAGVGTTCALTADAITHSVANIAIVKLKASSIRTIVGVAPDGAHEALVHTGGSIETAPIVKEVFELRDSKRAPPDYITLR